MKKEAIKTTVQIEEEKEKREVQNLNKKKNESVYLQSQTTTVLPKKAYSSSDHSPSSSPPSAVPLEALGCSIQISSHNLYPPGTFLPRTLAFS